MLTVCAGEALLPWLRDSAAARRAAPEPTAVARPDWSPASNAERRPSEQALSPQRVPPAEAVGLEALRASGQRKAYFHIEDTRASRLTSKYRNAHPAMPYPR